MLPAQLRSSPESARLPEFFGQAGTALAEFLADREQITIFGEPAFPLDAKHAHDELFLFWPLRSRGSSVFLIGRFGDEPMEVLRGESIGDLPHRLHGEYIRRVVPDLIRWAHRTDRGIEHSMRADPDSWEVMRFPEQQAVAWRFPFWLVAALIVAHSLRAAHDPRWRPPWAQDGNFTLRVLTCLLGSAVGVPTWRTVPICQGRGVDHWAVLRRAMRVELRGKVVCAGLDWTPILIWLDACEEYGGDDHATAKAVGLMREWHQQLSKLSDADGRSLVDRDHLPFDLTFRAAAGP